MKSDKNFNDASTDELREQLDMLVHQRTQNQARRRGIKESIEQLQKYQSELYAEYKTLDKEQAKVESELMKRRTEESDDEDAEDGDEPEVMTDGGVDIDEHIEPVFGRAIDEVAEENDVGREELAHAVADDLVWAGIYDEVDEYEEAIINSGDRDSLEVPDDLRDFVQWVHDHAAGHISGNRNYASHADVYVSPTSLAPENYAPANGDGDDE